MDSDADRFAEIVELARPGRSAEAALRLREWLGDADPAKCSDFNAVVTVGMAANEIGESSRAAAWGRRAAALEPDDFRGWLILGVSARNQEHHAEVIDALGRADSLIPSGADATGLIAGMLADSLSKEGRIEEALAQARRVAALDSPSAETLLLCGVIACSLDDRRLGLELLMRGSARGPADGYVEDMAIGFLTESHKAADVAPLADRLWEKSKTDGTALLRYAYRSIFIADWRDRDAVRERLVRELDAGLARGFVDCNTIWALENYGVGYDADLKVCRAVAARYRAPAVPLRARPERRKIRVGWLQVSTGFHSTMMATTNLAERADRSRFEIFGYGRRDKVLGPGHPGHAFQRRMRGSFDRFRDLSALDDDTAARAIGEDDLDVLLDMQGLNGNNNMGVVARRPARVVALYYGFSHSTGADYVDYFLADRVYMPPDLARIGSERIVYLPGCHMAPTLGEISETPIARAEVGLPDDAVVLCNFNNPWKHDSESFAAWMRILRAVPKAVLWLGAWNDTSVANLRRHTAEAGVDPGRVVFAEVVNHNRHLRRLGLADLALDDFYVGGGVTSLDTLWAGVPMVAMKGAAATPAAHRGACILAAADLGELIVDSKDAFEKLVVGLCEDRARLAALRARLVAGRATLPLFDIDGSARHVDRACEAMFENWAAGHPPRDIDIRPMWSRDLR